ncbi:MAG: sulfate reduction electron transfer complex DsrMKJOP subunit DsrJ [Desulfobacterales bacterium]|nr:sulfate reduction electron transfer complex DsrMKJOP subunit DsrJ [Desulfobacterales bacterium]
MHDKKWIIIGLSVFLAFFTFPFWYNMGKASPAPEPELTGKSAGAKACVEPKAYMKTRHMQLLNQWRASVVREEKKIYVSSTGKTFKMSLTQTCLDCHTEKSRFCDQCHTYVSVRPDCWDCHIDPKEISR